MTIHEIIDGIRAPAKGASELSQRHWNSLAKPLGSLGVLEEAITKISALVGEPISLEKAVLLVICADNGVIAQGVSQSDSSVTSAVAKALGEGTSTVCHMAKEAGCTVVPVNAGMVDDTPYPGVEDCCIRRGTADISEEPAMTREECERAILLGVELVRCQKQAGADIVLLGEMGIGNTTTTAAVSCALLGEKPELLAGRGAGLSDEGLSRKQKVICRALEINRPDSSDPVDILTKVGGMDLAVLTGACIGGAYYSIPILLDGVITCAAALCAVRLCPDCGCALLASHISREPAAALLLRELRLQPFLCADLHLGEGSGAVLTLPVLRQALAVYNSNHTFGELGIDAYQPQT